ncbi:hypothetical protein JCM5350_004464 [Sporobolomyces pararoseus]
MSVLQELAQKHSLPAISLTPMSNSSLPQELVDRLKANGHNNEGLYTMFAQSIESRSNCGIVRFSGSSNGLVLVAIPNQNKLLAIVFAKIALPAEWAQPSSSSSATASTTSNTNVNKQQQGQHSRTSTSQSLPPPTNSQRPPLQQTQSGMFSSPAAYPSTLPQSNPQPQVQVHQQQQQYPQAPQPFAGANKNNSNSYVPQQTPFNTGYNSSLNPSPQMQMQQTPQAAPPQQQSAAMSFPAGGVGGMDYSELEKLLGPEQLAAIMSGI